MTLFGLSDWRSTYLNDDGAEIRLPVLLQSLLVSWKEKEEETESRSTAGKHEYCNIRLFLWYYSIPLKHTVLCFNTLRMTDIHVFKSIFAAPQQFLFRRELILFSPFLGQILYLSRSRLSYLAVIFLHIEINKWICDFGSTNIVVSVCVVRWSLSLSLLLTRSSIRI